MGEEPKKAPPVQTQVASSQAERAEATASPMQVRGIGRHNRFSSYFVSSLLVAAVPSTAIPPEAFINLRNGNSNGVNMPSTEVTAPPRERSRLTQDDVRAALAGPLLGTDANLQQNWEADQRFGSAQNVVNKVNLFLNQLEQLATLVRENPGTPPDPNDYSLFAGLSSTELQTLAAGYGSLSADERNFFQLRSIAFFVNGAVEIQDRQSEGVSWFNLLQEAGDSGQPRVLGILETARQDVVAAQASSGFLAGVWDWITGRSRTGPVRTEEPADTVATVPVPTEGTPFEEISDEEARRVLAASGMDIDSLPDVQFGFEEVATLFYANSLEARLMGIFAPQGGVAPVVTDDDYYSAQAGAALDTYSFLANNYSREELAEHGFDISASAFASIPLAAIGSPEDRSRPQLAGWSLPEIWDKVKGEAFFWNVIFVGTSGLARAIGDVRAPLWQLGVGQINELFMEVSRTLNRDWVGVSGDPANPVPNSPLARYNAAEAEVKRLESRLTTLEQQRANPHLLPAAEQRIERDIDALSPELTTERRAQIQEASRKVGWLESNLNGMLAQRATATIPEQQQLIQAEIDALVPQVTEAREALDVARGPLATARAQAEAALQPLQAARAQVQEALQRLQTSIGAVRAGTISPNEGESRIATVLRNAGVRDISTILASRDVGAIDSVLMGEARGTLNAQGASAGTGMRVEFEILSPAAAGGDIGRMSARLAGTYEASQNAFLRVLWDPIRIVGYAPGFGTGAARIVSMPWRIGENTFLELLGKTAAKTHPGQRWGAGGLGFLICAGMEYGFYELGGAVASHWSEPPETEETHEETAAAPAVAGQTPEEQREAQARPLAREIMADFNNLLRQGNGTYMQMRDPITQYLQASFGSGEEITEDALAGFDLDRLNAVKNNLHAMYEHMRTSHMSAQEAERYFYSAFFTTNNAGKAVTLIEKYVPEAERLDVFSDLFQSTLSQDAYGEDIVQVLAELPRFRSIAEPLLRFAEAAIPATSETARMNALFGILLEANLINQLPVVDLSLNEVAERLARSNLVASAPNLVARIDEFMPEEDRFDEYLNGLAVLRDDPNTEEEELLSALAVQRGANGQLSGPLVHLVPGADAQTAFNMLSFMFAQTGSLDNELLFRARDEAIVMLWNSTTTRARRSFFDYAAQTKQLETIERLLPQMSTDVAVETLNLFGEGQFRPNMLTLLNEDAARIFWNLKSPQGRANIWGAITDQEWKAAHPFLVTVTTTRNRRGRITATTTTANDWPEEAAAE